MALGQEKNVLFAVTSCFFHGSVGRFFFFFVFCFLLLFFFFFWGGGGVGGSV